MRDHVTLPRQDQRATWRLANESDDAMLVGLCQELYREDPGSLTELAPRTRETLVALRREPWRGRAVVLEADRQIIGYALLVAFWSNHLGGEVCEVDELFVAPGFRGRGHGAALFREIERGGGLWPGPVAGIALGITPTNVRARRLYERLGLVEAGVTMVKSLRSPSSRAAPGAPAGAPGGR